MKQITGSMQASGKRFGVIVGRFNEMITRQLLQGAVDALQHHGAAEENITVAWVPGAYEIPVAAKAMAQSGEYDAVICLGCVIRGATAHFDYVAGPAASGISQAALDTGIPVIFGVLTTDTIEQAVERSGTKCGNKGRDAAACAIEMSNLLEKLEHPVNHTRGVAPAFQNLRPSV